MKAGEIEQSKLTCPVAMKRAVTILAACALNPPMAPATAEPTRFLLIFTSANADTLVFNTWKKNNNYHIITVQCTIQEPTSDTSIGLHLVNHTSWYNGFTYDWLPSSLDPVDCCCFLVSAVVSAQTDHLHCGEDFLHVLQGLLWSLKETKTPNSWAFYVWPCALCFVFSSCSITILLNITLDSMFMPMASPDDATNRINNSRPAMAHWTDFSFANLEVTEVWWNV